MTLEERTIDKPLTFIIDFELEPREQPRTDVCYHCGAKMMLTHNFKAVGYETWSAICRNCALDWLKWDKATRKRLHVNLLPRIEAMGQTYEALGESLESEQFDEGDVHEDELFVSVKDVIELLTKTERSGE